MDKKSKVFFVVFFSIIITVVCFSFYKYFILKDYYITLEAKCDPNVESCFEYICNPEVDGICSEEPKENVNYYKLIHRKASSLENCSQSGIEDCSLLTCNESEDCQQILCDSNTLSDGEQCSNPDLVGKDENNGDLGGVLDDLKVETVFSE